MTHPIGQPPGQRGADEPSCDLTCSCVRRAELEAEVTHLRTMLGHIIAVVGDKPSPGGARAAQSLARAALS